MRSFKVTESLERIANKVVKVGGKTSNLPGVKENPNLRNRMILSKAETCYVLIYRRKTKP